MDAMIAMSLAYQYDTTIGGDGRLTMPQARNQRMMDRGNDIIYLTLPVKLSNRKKFPAKPQAREQALSVISLWIVSYPV